MALFPITGRYFGDFIPHLVAADTDEFAPLGHAMIEGGAQLLAGSGRGVPEIAADVRSAWSKLIEDGGLRASAG